MERISEEREEDIEIYDDDIDLYLEQFREEQNIDDYREISQNVWNAALMYVQKHVFPDRSMLKSTKLTPDIACIPTTFGAYDYDKLNAICDRYIYLCGLYDKLVMPMGFSYLTGVGVDNIYSWANGDSGNLSKSSSEIFKKLRMSREDSIASRLGGGKQNPVGLIAMLNHYDNWNMPGVTRELVDRRALTADRLPQLGAKAPDELPEKIDLNYPVSEVVGDDE